MLTGIARLAAESHTLETKRQVEYFEMEARSILNRTKPGMPFEWTINPYRGCEFGCKYCYARDTHEYMEQPANVFEDRIYAKAGAAGLLTRDLRKAADWEAIAIGTATDPYQPAERRYRRTREMLQVLARGKGRRVFITTKSDLVARDVDVICELATHNTIQINITVTTMDAKLARIMEPRAPRPDLRIKAVGTLSEAGIAVGVYASPVLPLINDSERSLSAVAKAAKDAGARYFGGNVLFLKPASREVFFIFLQENYPHLVSRYRERFHNEIRLKGAYPETIRTRVHKIREQFGLDTAPPPPPEPPPTLFQIH
jgi:DNA repair photolyase